jgi:transcription termination factor Rho
MGSISIIATILVDTGSRMDEVIYEEFKGTGNMELTLSRDLANIRVFPAIDISLSSTRRAELLFEPEEFRGFEQLRRGLAAMDPVPAMKKLIELLQKYPKNSDLLNAFKDVQY